MQYPSFYKFVCIVMITVNAAAAADEDVMMMMRTLTMCTGQHHYRCQEAAVVQLQAAFQQYLPIRMDQVSGQLVTARFKVHVFI